MYTSVTPGVPGPVYCRILHPSILIKSLSHCLRVGQELHPVFLFVCFNKLWCLTIWLDLKSGMNLPQLGPQASNVLVLTCSKSTKFRNLCRHSRHSCTPCHSTPRTRATTCRYCTPRARAPHHPTALLLPIPTQRTACALPHRWLRDTRGPTAGCPASRAVSCATHGIRR